MKQIIYFVSLFLLKNITWSELEKKKKSKTIDSNLYHQFLTQCQVHEVMILGHCDLRFTHVTVSE